MARKKEIGRDRILDAAEAVILETEGRHFTLDAVAARAGISKGGLIYSFPTKDALITAALEREMARFQAAVDKRVAVSTLPFPYGRLFGHIEEILAEDGLSTEKLAFMMTVLVHAPELMAGTARQLYRALFDLFDPATLPGRDARQAVLAAEGLFLMRGLGVAAISAEEWTSVLLHARDTVLRAARAAESS